MTFQLGGSLVQILAFVSLLTVSAARAEHDAGTAAVTEAGATDPNALGCPSEVPDERVVSEFLRERLKPYVRKLERKVFFYHYGWRTARYPQGAPAGTYDDSVAVPSKTDPTDFKGPLDLKPATTIDGKKTTLAEHYFRTKTKSFFESNTVTGEYGSGLYTATDPLDSLHYSGKSGLLLRIGIPAQTSYLDLRLAGKSIPMRASEARVALCALKAACLTNECRTNVNSDWAAMVKSNQYDVSIKSFLTNPGSSRLLKGAFDKLEVKFIAGRWGEYQFGECKLNPNLPRMTDAVFTDPSFASQLDLSLFTPSLEESISPEKRKAYEEVMRYFDSFNFDQIEKTRFGDSSEQMRSAVTQKYWEYYRAWAPKLRNLPPGTDLKAYQREQSKKFRDPKERKKALTSELFGCSEDHPSEYNPPERVEIK